MSVCLGSPTTKNNHKQTNKRTRKGNSSVASLCVDLQIANYELQIANYDRLRFIRIPSPMSSHSNRSLRSRTSARRRRRGEAAIQLCASSISLKRTNQGDSVSYVNYEAEQLTFVSLPLCARWCRRTPTRIPPGQRECCCALALASFRPRAGERPNERRCRVAAANFPFRPDSEPERRAANSRRPRQLLVQ